MSVYLSVAFQETYQPVKTVNIDFTTAFLVLHKRQSTQLSVYLNSCKRVQYFQVLALQLSCFPI